MEEVYMYRRISSHNQINNNSLNAQQEAIRKFAEGNGFHIAGDYVDVAKSGTTTKGRDGYQKMLHDLECHPQVKYVVVHKLDRLHRNTHEALDMIYAFRAKKIGILTTDGLNTLDENCVTDILDEAVSAEKYSRRLSEETMKGLKVNAEKMYHNGGIPPYGYVVGTDRKLHIDEAKAKIVRQIFTMYAAGLSYHKIIQWLDANGCQTARGNPFGMTSIKTILENEKYCGTYVWNKRASKDFRGMRNNHKHKDTYYHVPDAIPAIIEKDVFQKVQDRLHDNKNRVRAHNGRNYYPLNGKVFCLKCGEKLSGQVQYSRTNKNNEPVKQYKFHCGCSAVKTVNEKYLDDMILYGLRECIFSPVNRDRLLQELNAYSKTQNKEIDLQISCLQAEKADTQKRIQNLIRAIENGSSSASITDSIQSLEKEVEQLEEKIQAYAASKKVFTPEDLDQIRSRFPTYVREEQNTETLAFLDDVVDSVAIDDTITVKLKKNIPVDREIKRIFHG